jgi:hypothetical protein
MVQKELMSKAAVESLESLLLTAAIAVGTLAWAPQGNQGKYWSFISLNNSFAYSMGPDKSYGFISQLMYCLKPIFLQNISSHKANQINLKISKILYRESC